MLNLTRHFMQNWEMRVGGVATVDLVQTIIRDAIIIQQCRNVQLPDGTRYRILAIYWHTELDVVIKVDEFAGNVVSVFSKSMRRAEKKGGVS